MDSGRWGILGYPAPFLTGPGRGAGVTGNALCPVSGVRARAVPSSELATSLTAQPGAPRLPLPPHPQPKAGKTRNLGSGAEATDQVRARVEGSGRNSVWPPGVA